MKMLTARYLQNPDTAIDDAVGKTDAFFFEDTLSKEIITLWSEGKDNEAYSKLKDYVSRISTTIS